MSQTPPEIIPLVELNAPALAGRVKVLDTLPASTYVRRSGVVWFGDSDAGGRYQPYYQRPEAKVPASSLYRIRHAELRGKGIITLDRQVVRNNLEGAPLERVLLSIAREASPVRHIREPLLYLTRYGIKNYGHWLTDIIPRLLWFRARYPAIKLAIHPESPRPILELLGWFGMGEQDIVSLGDEHVAVDELYFVDLWNVHPLIHAPRIFEYLAVLKQRVLGGQVPASIGKGGKYFVTRQDARTRHLENHQEVADWLRLRGFQEVACGHLSLGEQIRLFAGAEQVVGLAGAAMTNMVFCAPSTKIVTLAPATMPALYFWDLAYHAGLDYAIAYFQSSSPDAGIQSDFAVDIDALASVFDAMSM